MSYSRYRFLISQLHSFEHRVFLSMINRDDGQVIPDYHATNIENWLIRDQGMLTMRDGITARGSSPSATNLGTVVLNKSNGQKIFIRVINGAGNTSKFQHSTDGITWTDSTSGGSRATGAVWSLVQANDNVYGVNGTDVAIKHDGTIVSTIAAIPQGTALEWWNNYLWVFGNPIFKDRLYFSNIANPEVYTASDYVNINLGDTSNGVGVKGMAGATGRLFLGKKRSFWYITGSSLANFVLAPLTYEFGLASNESMVYIKNDVWCIDQDGNVRRLYRTSNDIPFGANMSRSIQATINGLNKASLYKASAVYFNNYALFFVPYGVDDYNSRVLVFDTLADGGKGGWIQFTGWNIARASVFTTTTPQLYLHDARTNNGQTYQWTGTSDNGLAIVAKYETKIYDHGFPQQEKQWKFAYQFGPVLGNVNVRFYVSIDRYYYALLKTFALVGTGNKLLGQTWTLGQDKLGSGGFVKQKINYTDSGGANRGTTQQVKLEAESTTVAVQIRMFTSHFYLRQLR